MTSKTPRATESTPYHRGDQSTRHPEDYYGSRTYHREPNSSGYDHNYDHDSSGYDHNYDHDYDYRYSRGHGYDRDYHGSGYLDQSQGEDDYYHHKGKKRKHDKDFVNEKPSYYYPVSERNDSDLRKTLTRLNSKVSLSQLKSSSVSSTLSRQRKQTSSSAAEEGQILSPDPGSSKSIEEKNLSKESDQTGDRDSKDKSSPTRSLVELSRPALSRMTSDPRKLLKVERDPMTSRNRDQNQELEKLDPTIAAANLAPSVLKSKSHSPIPGQPSNSSSTSFYPIKSEANLQSNFYPPAPDASFATATSSSSLSMDENFFLKAQLKEKESTIQSIQSLIEITTSNNKESNAKLWKELEKKDEKILKLELELKKYKDLLKKEVGIRKHKEREVSEKRKQRDGVHEKLKRKEKDFEELREWVEREWKGQVGNENQNDREEKLNKIQQEGLENTNRNHQVNQEGVKGNQNDEKNVKRIRLDLDSTAAGEESIIKIKDEDDESFEIKEENNEESASLKLNFLDDEEEDGEEEEEDGDEDRDLA